MKFHFLLRAFLLSGILWQAHFASAGCHGTARPCHSLAGHDGAACQAQRGCAWVGHCSGVRASECDEFENKDDCDSQEYCSWQWEFEMCWGFIPGCADLSGSACRRNRGCDWLEVCEGTAHTCRDGDFPDISSCLNQYGCEWTPNTELVGTCFSERSTVQVWGQGPTALPDVQVGDRILTKNGYQPMYAFAHYQLEQVAEFLQIFTDGRKAPLEISKQHLLFIEGVTKPVRADSIKVGDILLSLDHQAKVTKIKITQRTGSFAPLTPDGTVVVDGIVASNYVSLGELEKHPLFQGFMIFDWAPFRLLCTHGKHLDLCKAEASKNGIPPLLQSMLHLLVWVLAQPLLVQVLALLVYFVTVGVALVVDHVIEFGKVAIVWIGPVLLVLLFLQFRISAKPVSYEQKKTV